MTPTCDSAESIATLPPESDLDDEQIRDMLASPLHLQDERSKCRPIEFIIPTEQTLCQFHLTSEEVRGDLPQCSRTKESRVNNHVPTEKVFLWHTEHFEEKTEVASIFSDFPFCE